MSLLEMKHIKKEFGGFRQVYAAPLCDDAGDDR